MRIISGKYKGRRLAPPAGLQVRPTTGQAREALFNILMTRDLQQLEVLDLFAGTGSISFEFISRGAAKVVAIEKNYRCVEFIIAVQEQLEIHNMMTYQADVMKFLQRTEDTYDIIFADPPYDMEELHLLPDKILTNNYLKPEGMLILEHDKRHDFSDHHAIRDQRRYGKVHFSFFS
ncbi:MAG: 16S rRNA (guanine(966)-N(2))-methyltransferase RsmD [Bacteroidales bacterium]